MTSSMTSEIAEVLEKAADTLDERGWVQRCYTSNIGMCAVGAINSVIYGAAEAAITGYHPKSSNVTRSLLNFLEIKAHVDFSTALILWNDTAGRTKFEVVNVFRKCAEQLRSDG